jgi:predicted negative regulator of RcsB-dependent stress response
MKSGFLAAGAVVGLGLVLVFSLFFGYIGWSNGANKYEADIPAQYSQMQNVYDNGWKQVMEENQIPQNYADQVKEVFQSVMLGRYGVDGSKATFQMIQEQNPNLDSSLYKKVQESIERFHAEFQGSQTQIVALKQSYQTYIAATTSGRIYNTFGNYPHIKCGVPAGSADDYQIVTSGKTQDDFKSHKADVLDLGKKK